MSTMTLRITSSAVNAAGTGLGQGPDLGAPSFYDAIITDSTNPNLPNGTYDAYCLHPLLVINFSPTLYDATGSDGENIADYIAADVAAITDTQIDQINWLLAQNFTADPIFAGQYNYGEVQAAIYEILGYTPAEYNIGITPDILSDNGRQTLERTDIDFLVAQAQAAIASGNNVVPTDAYFSALIDPEGNVQPLIVQLQSAKLGNFVWQDDNNNGIQDAGELGVNNVVVELYDDAGTLIASTTTGDDFSTAAVETGFYQFTGLSAGDYQVKFVPPANMALTVKDANSNGQDTLDSDADTTTGLSDIISLSAGESNQTIDAGLVQPTPEPASISGFVYCDENDDGVKDAGEAGLGGVTVQLLNAAGAVVSTTTTDTDGSYSFTGLDAGTYSVVEPNQPAGKDDGQETAGSTGGNTDVNDTISQITVNAGEDSVNNNFGEVTPPPEPASISGFVYCDENDDGVKDAGEAGLGGVTVQLLNAAGAVVSTTTTDTDGSYSFTGLDAGTYSVVEPNQPAGKDDGQETAGSTGGDTSVNDTISQITVDAGEDSTDNNFGEVTPPPEPASISGFVYCDENDDGVKDAGETGLGGVTVQLLNAAGAVVSTTTTDADGAYSFTGLDAGTYSVVEPNQPAGKNDGQETAGSTGGNTTVNDTISEITVNAGEDSTDNNFGEVTPPPEPASISGFVYCDENDDGVKDAGEAGLGGVTVQLLNAAGAVVSTTTTDTDGSYSFTGLDAGTYSVVEPNQPAGKDDGQETAGSTGGNTDVNDTISQITVNAGEDSVNNNFGEVTPPPEPASISGFVYCDENDDGVKDAGEAGLGGVTVQLLNAAGAVVSTTTTDTDGSYSFTGLDAGTYSVVEPNQPAGKDDGQETAGSTGGDTSVNDTISQITVDAGEDSTDNNFGEVTPPPEPASISGFVYCDENDDGVKDAGEAGLGGVTVQLLNAAGAVVSTTTTDTDGSYSFTGLDAGTYSVVEPNQPAGKDDGQETAGSTGGDTSVNDTISQITVDAGEDSTDNNFGEVTPPPEPASISGFVYCDENDDGVKDAGETGLGGVTVQLLNAAGAVVSTTTTDTDGSYSFTGLDAGTYSVVEPNQPAGKDDGQETAGSTGGNTDVNDTISQITVNAGEDSVNNNFGEVTPPPEPASISGFVYCDENDDGVKDAGEAGLGGVTVQLLNAAGAVVSTTTTDTDGSYSFTGLDAGTYSVVEPNQPAGKDDGQETAGSTGGNTDVNDTISQITVNAGEDSVNNNFGEVTPPPEPASISGFVYCDENDDGVKDAGEAGLGGVTVQLLNAAGAVVSTTTTDTDGSYSFTGLDAGTYSVVEPNQPAGKDDGQETAGSTGGDTSVNDTISQITVDAGEDSTDNNFGEVTPPPEPASISGFVYCDENDDGVKDAGETGLGGVTVQLLNAAGAVVSTTTTDADGAYSFTGLDAGTYSVVEPNQPAGKNDGQETAGSTGGNTTVNDTISEITVNAGEDSTDNNFGEVTPPPEPASISGFVYCDENDDGVKDAGEAGLGGVTVQLLNAAGAVVSTTTTDTDGSYSFTGLDAGTYSVVEPNQPAGKDDGQETAGSTGGNTDVNDTISQITVNAGEDSVNNNFGEVTPPPEPASISGFVYCDENDDGVKDAGEAGLGGVTVQLLNAAGAVVSTTTTDTDGSYSFTGLDAGTYSVVEPNQPAGKDDGQETAGSTGGDTSVNDTISQITVDAGEDSTDNNFGEVTPPPEPASISGFVYCDENDDGVKDAGEAGLGGVTVQLLNAAGAVVSTTTTDTDGSYSFTGLDAGTYSVVEPNQPAGKDDGQETAGSTGGDTSVNDTISQITVDAGEDSTDNNFGEVTPPPEPASISGFVYCDENDDGVKDAGETGLGGVTVQLLNAAGAVVSTTTTDTDGSYSFTGLDAGTYSVVEPNQPAGKDDGQETAGSTGGNTDVNDTISQITVNAGEDSTDNNFGEVTPPPEPASISGFVYCDENDDGVKDAGEAGLGGVTVQLLNAAGAVVSTTTTDTDGSYSFTGLDAGTYSVVEPNQPAGKDDGQETAGSTGGNTDVNDTISQITVNAGEDSVNNNFGEVTPPPEPASISGFVYCDENDDGVKDAGEAGLGGVTVQLLNAAGAVVSTTTTDADGAYSFTGLDAGTYSVVEPNQPAGKDDGQETAGSTGGNTDVNDTISQITVNAGEDSVNNNFGEVTPPPEPASISGFVYCDENDDGVKDAGEAGLGGVTVQLLNAAGAVVSTTTTDTDGSYSFTGLDAGTYSVVEPNQPAGKDDGQETAGSTGGNTDVNDTISQITVNAGEDSVNNNFGEVTPPPEPASISGFVYCDENDDGVKDAGEAGLGGVTVQLLNAAGAVVSTTTTDTDGSYSFTGLDAGTYSVVEPNQPAGKNDGQETAGSTGGNTTVNDTISEITVDAGEDSVNNNFGEVTPPPEPASISGFVYCDENDDGVKDAGEAGLGGVTVQLLNAAGAVVSTTTTDTDGSYSFTGLDAGTYSVVEPNQPAGKDDGQETAGSTGGNTDVNDTISQITVNAGEDSVNNNFGEVTPPPEPASISGFVYCDENDDGVKDAGEAGLGGVTVQLLNAAGAVVSTTTTDTDGSYSFTGLDAGTYSVVEPNQPAGKNDGQETAGSTGGNTTVNDTISEITVNAGEDSTDNNFGEVTPPPEPASISGFVYCDENDDGVKDAGEAGLGGVTVQLLNAAGAVVSTTTTDTDGSYSFTGLDAGTYSVVEPSQPAGKNDGQETAGSTGGNTDVNDTISEITVNAGENSTDNNFGEVTQAPGIDIEKFVNGIDVTDLNVLPEIAAGADVTFTYNVTNTGNVAFTQAEVLVKDDNGTPSNLADDFIPTLVTTSDAGSDGILSAGETWLYTSTTMAAQDLSVTTNSDANFVFSGSSSTTGSNGNVRTFTANGVTVDASAHSRSASGDWNTGYVGIYNGGLGVTNSGESGSHHRVDNGTQVDYLLFEFDKDVTVDKALLKSVVNDSDISIWVGDRNGADISSLSDGLLQSFAKENDFTNSSNSRWADINDGGLTGDTLVISAHTGGSNDQFKLKKLTTSVSETAGNGEYLNIATVTVDGDSDSDASGYINPVSTTPGIDIEKFVNGIDVTDLNVLPEIAAGADVTFTYNVTNTGNVAFTQAEVLVKDDNGTPSNLADDFIPTLVTTSDAGSDGILSAGETWLYTSTTMTAQDLSVTTNSDANFVFSGSSSTTGSNGNVRTFTANGVTVDASAHSRSASGDWDTGYVGIYNGGLGVTNSGETGSHHRVDNGTQVDYLLFEFDKDVTVDKALLKSVVNDSDISIWVGDRNGADISSLSDGLLQSFAKENDFTNSSNSRWADINDGGLTGDTLVISAHTGGSNDQFKLNKLTTSVSETVGNGEYLNIATVTVDGDSDSDASGYVNPAVTQKASIGNRVWEDMNHNGIQDSNEPGISGITATLYAKNGSSQYVAAQTTTDSNGNYLFANLAEGYYFIEFDKAGVRHDSGWGGNFNMSDWYWANKDAGTNDNIDSDVYKLSGDTTYTDWTYLDAGENDLSWDAGITPIVIDLDGDGVETISREDAQGTFDLLGTGNAIQSGWVGSDDGLLAIDTNNNGTIDDISELFGGSNKGDGFAKLASYDSNDDGVVNADDVDFSNLLVWQDTNGNHETDANELTSFVDAGIESLAVSFTELPFIDAQDNLHLERSSATLTNGTTVDMTDVYFNVSLADAQAAGIDSPSLAELSGYDQVIPEEVVDVPSAFVADPIWTAV